MKKTSSKTTAAKSPATQIADLIAKFDPKIAKLIREARAAVRKRTTAPPPRVEPAGFGARLDEINALADASAGFVWRLQTDAGDATKLRPYDDDRILFNLSVWETPAQLRDYVYRSMHAEVLRQRQAWFAQFVGVYYALCWVPAGHIPGIAEAKSRLEELRAHGATARAFNFAQLFPAPSEFGH